jgi:hypothetical protein
MNNQILNKTISLLSGFDPISLSEMDKVKLMDRVDSKFILSYPLLAPVLKTLGNQYRVLTIDNHKAFSYRTEYFDTNELRMFSDHHNGKLNRYKIRQREYVESKLKFLEVKFKSNKGRVIKDRIEKTAEDPVAFSLFVHKYTPYNPDNLNVILTNTFNRFTLVDNVMQERVTVDFNLSFTDQFKNIDLKNLVIIEVKQNKNSRNSYIFNALKENGIRTHSLSKYCLGVSMLNRHSKFNNFKKTIHRVKKLNHDEST